MVSQIPNSPAGLEPLPDDDSEEATHKEPATDEEKETDESEDE